MNFKHLADALTKALHNKKGLKQLGDNGRKTVFTEYYCEGEEAVLVKLYRSPT
jgi:hypothetical protein